MGIYKFVSSRYIDDVLDGKFFFRPLMYFRLLEVVNGDDLDDLIGDREEGRVTINVDNVKIASGVVGNNVRGKLSKLGISGGGGIEIKSSSFVKGIEGFVFCCSAGELSGLKKPMMKDEYDSCVSFPDIKALVEKLYYHGLCDDGRAVSDVFCPPDARYVNYCEEPISFDEISDKFSVSPFIKRKKYVEQQEFRIFLQPKQTLDVDSITLKINPLGLVVEEIRGDVLQKLTPEITPESLEVSLGKLKEIVVRMRARRDEYTDFIIRALGIEALHAAERTYEVDEFNKFDKVPAFLAYWNLRNQYKYRCSRVDRFFVLENKNGGAITGFITYMSDYCHRVEAAISQLNDGGQSHAAPR